VSPTALTDLIYSRFCQCFQCLYITWAKAELLFDHWLIDAVLSTHPPNEVQFKLHKAIID
jgi:hypothetical protein